MNASTAQHSSPQIREKLLRRFKALLPAEQVLYSDEDLRPYECDGLSAYRKLPLAVVLPDTIEQVQTILKACSEFEVPVVARGAGTGLSGGALPHEQGVLLSLARFNRIVQVDPQQRIARVQPGVRNLAISEAVAQHGLYYAPDPSSQIACSIGGNVAENAGGVHCLKYGLTVHNIQQLKVVTIDGELLTLGGSGLDAPGYDLLALMTGSEGMLGVIVEVTVKLLPKPDRAQVILAAFDDVVRAGEAVGNIISAGIIPAGLEMMDKLAIQAAEDFVHAGYPVGADAILLCELDGTNEEVSAHVYQVREILNHTGATEVRTASSDAERMNFWKGRKAAFPAVGRISPDYYCMDGTIPRKHLPEVLGKMAELSKEYDLRVANVFHAGDGNLHPLILYDANKPGELERTEEFGGKILELCVEVGGTITGEHGVGMEKINQMCVQFDARELTQFHAIKNAFDPRGLLNPGKAVPTLHRCAEFGAMHVHHGELPFPELDRF
ncbi:FAD-linked oxidase C-terminal domain-containing protein [Thiohalophilus sp.]|uniref:FAD-linked oxidase C-terminal domain-containing protein n=1 Tax=Thiohalophilus sp. TaxID=3028392 RepID=UPI002ACE3C68|nr:FAD-linked oxidase C-terminal domain-containing protein [Thiohalophilus sp.]MDZ7661886.1 FAD-linked oxidase C-terminal domain-containing protein [Thiohalophilus sp.]MDZ7803751.1 FAD-linked oxidase C-terminal domain-containing protein [Thiohalophilus sp.]